MEKLIQISQTRIYGFVCFFMLLASIQMFIIDIFGLSLLLELLAKLTIIILSLIIIIKNSYILDYSVSELRKLVKFENTCSVNIQKIIYKTSHIKSELIPIYLTGYSFGIILYLASLLFNLSNPYKMYGIYLISTIIYHNGEFIHVCFYRFKDLEWQSFLINHSPGYNLAFALCQLEFFLESVVFQFEFKNCLILSMVGIVFSIIGHIFRIGAFMQAKSNFHHLVQTKKQNDHQLVTHGLYSQFFKQIVYFFSISRHPSYFGFFIQSLGSQLMLINPICFLGYIVVLWRFFYQRIFYEEIYLVEFFGQDYIDYRQKVNSLIPFLDYFLNRTDKKNYDE